MTERVYYVPPDGSEPLDFELSSRLHVFYPQDKIWKRVDQEYVVGILMNNKLGVPRMDPRNPGKMLEHKAKRKVWAVDKEKTEALQQGLIPKPKNWLDCNEDMLVELAKGQYAEKAAFLKREKEIEQKQRDDYKRVMDAGDREIEELKATIEKRKRALQRQAEELGAKLKKAGKTDVENPPPAS